MTTTTKPAREPYIVVTKALASRDDLCSTDKLLLADIENRIGHNGKAWPSEQRLAEDLGVNRGTIAESLLRLEKVGEIEVDRRGRGKANHYRIAPKSCRETQPLEHCEVAGKPSNLEKGELPGKPTRGCRETRPQVAGKPSPNTPTPLNTNQGEPAAPPAADPGLGHVWQKAPEPSPTPPNGNAAGGRVVAAWLDGFRAATRRPFAKSGTGRVAGTMKALLGDFDEETLTAAVERWFGAPRPDFGIGLFQAKLVGGSGELLGPAFGAATDLAPPRSPTDADVAVAYGKEVE